MDRDQAPKITVLPARAAHGVRRPIVSRSGPAVVEIAEATRSTGPAARPWEARGSIDVEQLAIWAFRDQRAHRHAGAGLHRIEADAEGLVSYGRSADGCAVLADIENLGCRIDRRVGIVRDTVHPAADAVAVLAERIEGGALVRHYATLGGRPDGWVEPEHWFRPVVWVRQGKEAQWEWERSEQGGRSRITRIIATRTRAELVGARTEYMRWWEALDVLAFRLSMRALGFTVRPPEAPAEPWGVADAT